MQHFKFLNWWIGEFVVSFFDVTNRLIVSPWLRTQILSKVSQSISTQKTDLRLAEKVFDPELAPDGKPSKWWTCFSKRNFLKAPVIAWRDLFLKQYYLGFKLCDFYLIPCIMRFEVLEII